MSGCNSVDWTQNLNNGVYCYEFTRKYFLYVWRLPTGDGYAYGVNKQRPDGLAPTLEDAKEMAWKTTAGMISAQLERVAEEIGEWANKITDSLPRIELA